MARGKGEKPKRPAGSPIYPHASGSWAANIGGRKVYLGAWDDYRGALQRYEDKLYELSPRPDVRPVVGVPVTLEKLANRFLTFHMSRVKQKTITPRSFRDMTAAVVRFSEVVGDQRRVHSLAPADFAKAREQLAVTCGPDAMNRNLTLIRQMFKWGVKELLIPAEPPYGHSFAKESRKNVRKSHRDATAKHGRKVFSPVEIQKLVSIAPPQLKAMILLAVNAGFANTDCAVLPKSAVNLDTGFIEWRREKTGIDRRCPLWPVTVDAVREAINARPKAKSDEHDGLAFLTAFGVPWVREKLRIAGASPVSIVDSIGMMFKKLQPADMLQTQRGFQSLRRTFATFADAAGDDAAKDFIMGHADDEVARRYVQGIEDHRLYSVTDYVHLKIFGASPKRESPRQHPAKKNKKTPQPAAG